MRLFGTEASTARSSHLRPGCTTERCIRAVGVTKRSTVPGPYESRVTMSPIASSGNSGRAAPEPKDDDGGSSRRVHTGPDRAPLLPEEPMKTCSRMGVTLVTAATVLLASAGIAQGYDPYTPATSVAMQIAR